MLNIKKRATAVALLALLAGSPTTTPFLYSSVLAEENTEKVQKPAEKPAGEKTEADKTISSVVEKESAILPNSSVFSIQIGYEFEDGSFDEWQKGTGYLVSNQEILTIQSLADTSASNSLYKTILDKKAEAYKTAGIDLKNEAEVEKHFKIKVTNSDGEMLAVKANTSKNGLGLISLEKTTQSTPAVFEEEGDVNNTEGTKYKLKVSDLVNKKAEITEVEGLLVKPATNAASGTLALKADVSKGNPVGSPVYNEKGNIIGMVTGTGDALTVVPSGGLQTFLNNNGVKFDTRITAEKKREAKEKEEAEKALKDAERASLTTKALEEAIQKAEAVNGSDYKKSGYEALMSAVSEAKKILENEDNTQAEVDSAEKKINDAYSSLEEYTLLDKLKLPLIIGTVIILLGGLIALIVLKIKKGKKVAKPNKKMPVAMPQEDTDFSEELRRMDEADLGSQKQSVHRPAHQEPVMQQRNSSGQYEEMDYGLDVTAQTSHAGLRTTNTNIPGIKFAEEGPDSPTDLTNQRYGQPDLLEDGGDETTLLGRTPYLVRDDDGRQIPLRHGFIIGKEVDKVNYAIKGNPSVSRTHAEFALIDGKYHIQDLRSKNYTYLNGNQLPEYRYAELNNGDKIRLANVSFTYYE